MTHTLHQLAADAGLQGRSADSPTNSVPAILHRQYITRLDGPARHRIIHGEPSLAERALVRLVWLVCAAYCVAIWIGVAR